MKLYSQLSNGLLGMLLGVLMLFPAAVQFTHIFEGHDHKPCEELTTHLHEKKIDCSICYFHLTNFTYDEISAVSKIAEIPLTEVLDGYLTPVFYSAKKSHFLRGPPLA